MLLVSLAMNRRRDSRLAFLRVPFGFFGSLYFSERYTNITLHHKLNHIVTRRHTLLYLLVSLLSTAILPIVDSFKHTTYRHGMLFAQCRVVTHNMMCIVKDCYPTELVPVSFYYIFAQRRLLSNAAPQRSKSVTS